MKHLFNFSYFIVFLLFNLSILSCSHFDKKKPSSPTRERLFPNGKYIQEVHIRMSLPERKEKENFHFQAVVNVQPEHLLVIGLSPLGITLFRLEKSLGHPPLFTSNLEILEKNRAFLLELFNDLEKVFYLKGASLEREGDLYKCNGQKFKIYFSQFGSNGQPHHISMSDDLHYWIQVSSRSGGLEK